MNLRKTIVAAFVLALSGCAGLAQSPHQLPSTDEVIRRARESIKKAKNQEEIESITAWCKFTLRNQSAREELRLMAQLLKFMEKNMNEEANALLKRVTALRELSNKTADLVCKPEALLIGK